MTENNRPDPTADPEQTEGLDPGAFVGSRPEREASTIPGGIGPKDERIAANSTQSGAIVDETTPASHREASSADADADATRESRQDR